MVSEELKDKYYELRAQLMLLGDDEFPFYDEFSFYDALVHSWEMGKLNDDALMNIIITRLEDAILWNIAQTHVHPEGASAAK